MNNITWEQTEDSRIKKFISLAKWISTHTLPWLAIWAIFLAGCGDKNKHEVEDVLQQLVKAMNEKDMQKAASLFNENSVNPKIINGDSSSIYRMISIPNGENFKLGDVGIDIEDSTAKASILITGDVRNGSNIVGKMHSKIGLILEKNEQGKWQIINGSETLE